MTPSTARRRRTLLVAGAVCLALVPSAAHAEPAPVERTYLVTVDAGSQDEVAARLERLGADPQRQFDEALDAVAVRMTAAQAAAASQLPDVGAVAADATFRVADTQAVDSAWGLDRIDQRNLPLDRSYTYDARAGVGVRVYVVDTGISPDTGFGTRLVAGYSAIADGRGTSDCHGHGTHVAGIVGATRWGVAKAATLVPVRVLGCTGQGATTGVVAGLEWIASRHPAGTPGVVNMSLGGPASTAVDTAVASLVAQGLTVVVAAGNESVDACTVSPARAPSALTVGATGQDDARAYFSNVGACLDLFAPGVQIPSSSPSSSAGAVMSGTSQASPHVAGAAALYLAQSPAATPVQVQLALLTAAQPVVRDARSASTLLLQSSVSASTAPVAVTATATTSSIRLAWTADGTFSRWTVLRRVVGTSTWQSSVVTRPTTTFSSLPPGTAVEVAITGVDAVGVTASTTLTTSTAAAPSAPGLTASATLRSATLSWTAPTVSAPLVTAYTVQRSTNGTTWTTAATTTKAVTTATVAGLTPGVRVWFRVSATAGTTPGTWSTPLAVTAAPAPGAPTGLAVTGTSARTATVTWAAPTVSAAHVQKYVVQRSLDGVTWRSVPTATPLATTATLTALTPGTEHLVRVAASGEGVTGAWTTPVRATTLPLPSQPLGVAASATMLTSTVTWDPPAQTSATTGYRVSWSTNGLSWRTLDVPADARTTTLVGLRPGTAYQVRVAARADGLLGPWSDVTAVTTVVAPSAPRTLTTTGRTTTSLTMTWAPSAAGATAVTAYRVERSTDGVTWTATTVAPTTTQVTLSALRRATTYRVRVSAVSPEVVSPAAQWSGATATS
ncbi:fibronectin type III domain-containing protein [Cellulomonas oligotrophica]|uniref:Subtilisin family serine protease n=1 Tax=Cellulomonas oligotrophica TaxID=931536 RepID=A0A7Y9FJ91_9CELL|nr:fibronectin type III domain-containing protein [Cellulomonas oligotrophica]NYD88002.1 subtilisin family serine protease [Cellulomonas oligotrophica]GIG34496.1 hypothetical protein Col01nite_36550 [Cellulomonas oligotrophica]